MWPAAVVVAKEGCQGAVASDAVGPDAAVGPFVVEGSDESLRLAVPARRARRDPDVAGIELAQRGAKRVALGVGERVVGHDRLDGAGALLGHPGRGAKQDLGRDVAAIVAVNLDVGESAVVIDNDVRELHAARANRAALLQKAVAVRPMTGLGEDRQLL